MSESYEDLVAREVVATRVIPASRERVFEAFSNAEALTRWWGPDGFTSTFHAFEFRAGGDWRFTFHGPDGATYENELVFASVDAPQRIVLDHLSQEQFRATITLDAIEGGTKVTFRQLFDTQQTFEAVSGVVIPANEQLLARLDAVVLGSALA